MVGHLCLELHGLLHRGVAYPCKSPIQDNRAGHFVDFSDVC